jgi:hypothetical protein
MIPNDAKIVDMLKRGPSVKCAECGGDLTDEDIRNRAEICYACWSWHVEYAELDDDD